VIWKFGEFFKKEKENLEKITLKKHICPKISQLFCSKKKKIIEENHHLATAFFFFFSSPFLRSQNDDFPGKKKKNQF